MRCGFERTNDATTPTPTPTPTRARSTRFTTTLEGRVILFPIPRSARARDAARTRDVGGETRTRT
jgi:hypothetical protein